MTDASSAPLSKEAPPLGGVGAALRLAPAVLASWVMAAHFLRFGQTGLVAAALLVPFLLIGRRRWSLRALQALLLGAAIDWIFVTVEFVRLRQMMGQDTGRLILILGAVSALTALAALPLNGRRMLQRFSVAQGSARVSLAVFLITVVMLAFVQVKVELRMLLLDRFWSGGGWVELLALGTYGAWLVEKMKDVKAAPKWRVRAWTLFSLVFFGQLGLGLLGYDSFLQTGTLHVPVPALIIGGPIYRGSGLFMPILFASTVAIVGPAWCSHLCYVGAWDQLASRGRRLPMRMQPWRGKARWVSTALVIIVALGLRLAGVSGTLAAIVGGAFGLVGVVLMLVWSRRKGVMTHCTAFCPMGLVATVAGKLNPFRVRIGSNCTDCNACITACRFDALSREDVQARKPGQACTLCGDCLARCPHDALEYRFLNLRGEAARSLFLVLIVSLHAIFLGLARI